MAVDEINGSGGFKVGDKTYVFDVAKKDLRSDPTAANSIFQGLIEDDKVLAIFGPTVGPTFASVYAVASQSKELIFAAGHGSDDAFAASVKSGVAKYEFKTSPPQFLGSQALVGAILKYVPAAKTVAILFPNDANGQLFAPAEKTLLEGKGVSVEITYYDPAATDFTVPLTAIKAKKPDVLLYGTTGAAVVTILRQAVELSVAGTFAGFGASVDDALKNATGGPIKQTAVFYVGPVDLNNPLTPKAKTFATNFAKVMNKTRFASLDAVSLYQYDFVYMFVAAMQKANSVTDRDAIAGALEQVSYNGVLGDGLSFGATHAINIRNVTICQVANGNVSCDLITP